MSGSFLSTRSIIVPKKLTHFSLNILTLFFTLFCLPHLLYYVPIKFVCYFSTRSMISLTKCSDEPYVLEYVLQLVATITHQSHLCPLPLLVQPIVWNYDHCLHLFPTPHTVIISLSRVLFESHCWFITQLQFHVIISDSYR